MPRNLDADQFGIPIKIITALPQGSLTGTGREVGCRLIPRWHQVT